MKKFFALVIAYFLFRFGYVHIRDASAPDWFVPWNMVCGVWGVAFGLAMYGLKPIWSKMGALLPERTPRAPYAKSYSHGFFSDGLKDHFFWSDGYGARQDRRIPSDFSSAMDEAARINPYLPNGDVVIYSNVLNENGKPAIYDDIVSREQIERFEQEGHWDETNGSMQEAFLSYFNGPTTRRVKRGGG